MATTFGKFCRKLRIDHDQILKDMADMLGVRSSFLSAVELGKKKIPTAWESKISERYKLNQKEILELQQAIEVSVTQVKLDLRGSSNDDRELVMLFARKLDNMTEEDREKLLKFLK